MLKLNLKFCIPSFQERFRTVLCKTKHYFTSVNSPLLDMGCGEGEYSLYLAGHFNVTGIDINPADIEYCLLAQSRNIDKADFLCRDVMTTALPDSSFQYILSIDVIEHLSEPGLLIKEASRLLKTGGIFILTFPSKTYPFTYDPVNKLIDVFSPDKRHIPLGAYGYGHEKLPSPAEINVILLQQSFSIIEQQGITFYLSGLLEMYWASIIQRIFKRNARNFEGVEIKQQIRRKTIVLRFLARNLLGHLLIPVYYLVSFCNFCDRSFFGKSKNSAGVLIVARKE